MQLGKNTVANVKVQKNKKEKVSTFAQGSVILTVQNEGNRQIKHK